MKVTTAGLSALLLSVLASAAPNTQVVNVPVSNPGFEAPAIPDGTFLTTAPPAEWEVYGDAIDFGGRTIGVLNPTGTTLYADPAPEGDNVGVVFLMDDFGNQTFFAGIEAGMEQTLATQLAANTRYTLTVEVGNITDDATPPNDQFEFQGFPGYRVELLAGGVPLVADLDSLLPAEGGFLTSTRQVTIPDAHPLVGQDLGVRLVNLNAAPGLEVNFDDVRLTAEPCASSASAQVVRLGQPANPAALLPGQSSGPVLGNLWDPVIDHGSFLPGSILDVLALGAAPVNLPSGLGTILCFPAIGSFVTLPGQPFAVPIPADCSLVGAGLCTQGVSWDGTVIALTNALDVTVGTF